MKILIDGRAFSLQKKGGVSQMWIKILSSKIFIQKFQMTLFLYPKYEENLHLRELLNKKSSMYNLIFCDIPPSDNTNFNKIEDKKYRKKLILESSWNEFDFVINTYYGENIYSKTLNYLVVAHDYAHEELETLKHKESTKNVKKLKNIAFQDASLVISVSNSTRIKGYEYYTILHNKKNYVIYHGHDECNEENFLKVKKQILYIGGRDGYKNFDIFFKIIPKLLQDLEVNIIIAGGEELDQPLSELINLYSPRILYMNNITDSEMNLLYKSSSVYLSTSLYEGFGIPVLYSMYFQCTPVLSNIPVYKEIARDNGVYFNPNDEEDLLQTLKDVLSSHSFEKNTIVRSWEKVSEEYFKVIERKVHES